MIRITVSDNTGFNYSIATENKEMAMQWLYETVVSCSKVNDYAPVATITAFQEEGK